MRSILLTSVPSCCFAAVLTPSKFVAVQTSSSFAVGLHLMQEFLALDWRAPAYDMWQLGCCCYCPAKSACRLPQLYVCSRYVHFFVRRKFLALDHWAPTYDLWQLGCCCYYTMAMYTCIPSYLQSIKTQDQHTLVVCFLYAGNSGFGSPGALLWQLGCCCDCPATCTCRLPQFNVCSFLCLQEILALDHRAPSYDMWQLGCCCYCLATGQELFVPQPGQYYDVNDKHLGEMTGVLGRIPRKVGFKDSSAWSWCAY